MIPLLLISLLAAGPARAATPGPDDYLREARRLLDEGRVDDAERALRRLIRNQPRSAGAHRLLGETLHRQHRYARARDEYREALRLDPKDLSARDGLEATRRARGPRFFGALGEWEADSSAPSGWQAELYYGGLDRLEARAGLSHADRHFYTRNRWYASAYRFHSATGYLKLTLGKKSYDFPTETNPVPDSNSYENVPGFEIEVAEDLDLWVPGLRGSLAYEFYRPTFFYAPDSHASNHKLSLELGWQTGFRPLRLRLLAAALRDPDPAGTVIDRASGQLVVLDYGWQALLGGGVELSSGGISGRLLLLPNPELDRSQSYAVITGVSGPLYGRFGGRADYIHGKYSDQSVFAGETANIWTFAVDWRAPKRFELSAGYKVARRPVHDDSGPFLTVLLRP